MSSTTFRADAGKSVFWGISEAENLIMKVNEKSCK